MFKIHPLGCPARCGIRIHANSAATTMNFSFLRTRNLPVRQAGLNFSPSKTKFKHTLINKMDNSLAIQLLQIWLSFSCLFLFLCDADAQASTSDSTIIRDSEMRVFNAHKTHFPQRQTKVSQSHSKLSLARLGETFADLAGDIGCGFAALGAHATKCTRLARFENEFVKR